MREPGPRPGSRVLMNLHILPLAITMLAGPQIMAAIIFVTADKPKLVSLPFIAAVAMAVILGTAVADAIAHLVGSGSAPSSGSGDKTVEYILVGLLIAMALKNYLGRETAEPPKWLGTLLDADAKTAFKTGLLLILLMPSDIVIMLTVGFDLDRTGSSFVDALPFIAATVLVASLPFLAYTLFRKRAQVAMPKVRDWMNANSWLVNIIVCIIFILLIVS